MVNDFLIQIVWKIDSAFKRQKSSDHAIILHGPAAMACVNVSPGYVIRTIINTKIDFLNISTISSYTFCEIGPMAPRLPTIRTLRIQIITWDNVISSFHKNKVWHDRKLCDDKSYDSAAPLKHCLSNSNYRHTLYYAIAREICSVFSEFMIWSTFFFSYFNASSNIVASCYSFQWYIQYHDPWSFHCHMQYAVNTFAKSGCFTCSVKCGNKLLIHYKI